MKQRSQSQVHANYVKQAKFKIMTLEYNQRLASLRRTELSLDAECTDGLIISCSCQQRYGNVKQLRTASVSGTY